jgi:PqqD family protein of HPr-rel-A system
MPDGSAVLYNPDTGQAYAVNGTAADVWVLCDGQRSAAAIVAVMAARFAAEPAVIEAGVAAVLAHFRALGLLESP